MFDAKYEIKLSLSYKTEWEMKLGALEIADTRKTERDLHAHVSAFDVGKLISAGPVCFGVVATYNRITRFCSQQMTVKLDRHMM